MEEASQLGDGYFEDPSDEAMRQLGEEIAESEFPFLNPFQGSDLKKFHNMVLVTSASLCTGLD